MNTIEKEALGQLTSAISTLLPDFNGAHPQPIFSVIPTQITPTGLGGFVGSNNDPLEDIVGRHIEATITVSAKAASAESLPEVVAEVSSAFICSVRQKIMNLEILRMIAADTGPTSDNLDSGSNGNLEKMLTFKVLCEFLKRQGPAEPGGIIETIPLDIGLNQTGNPPKILISESFDEQSMDLFDVIDDPLAKTATPSQWQYNPETFRIEQLSRIRGGPATPANAKKPGTYLVLSDHLRRLRTENFIVQSTVRSETKGGIGLVFKWQNTDNFYYFLMDSRNHFRVMAKKVDGVFSPLDTPALVTGQGYINNTDYDIKIYIENINFKMYLNNELVLQGQDSSIVPPGRIGLMSRDNKKACFYRLGLLQI
jgi:hypothetical protein